MVCQSVMLLVMSKLILSMPILGSTTTTISGSYSHIHHTSTRSIHQLMECELSSNLHMCVDLSCAHKLFTEGTEGRG